MAAEENPNEHPEEFDLIKEAAEVVAKAEETTPLPNPLAIEDRFREADNAMWAVRRKHGVVS